MLLGVRRHKMGSHFHGIFLMLPADQGVHYLRCFILKQTIPPPPHLNIDMCMHVNLDAVNFGEPTQDVGGYKAVAIV